MIITIGRQFCSGGSEIGRKLSEKLGIPYYDKNFSEHAAESNGFSSKFVNEVEETPSGSFLYSMAMYPYTGFGIDNLVPTGISVSSDQTNFILEKAKEGPCIFVGRCADNVLRNRNDVLTVFIYSDMEKRIERAVKRYNITEKEAIKSIKSTDKHRASYYNMNCHNKKWGEKESYNILLDSGSIGTDNAVEILASIYNSMNGKREP